MSAESQEHELTKVTYQQIQELVGTIAPVASKYFDRNSLNFILLLTLFKLRGLSVGVLLVRGEASDFVDLVVENLLGEEAASESKRAYAAVDQGLHDIKTLLLRDRGLCCGRRGPGLLNLLSGAHGGQLTGCEVECGGSAAFVNAANADL